MDIARLKVRITIEKLTMKVDEETIQMAGKITIPVMPIPIPTWWMRPKARLTTKIKP